MPQNHICGIRRGFPRLSPWQGQVAYVLLTRAPVADRSASTPSLPLDLHVLSLSLAFILSQDQTLRCCYILLIFFTFLFSSCPIHRAFAIKTCFKFWRRLVFYSSRTTCLVYCKYFNVLSSQNSFRFRVAIDTPFPFCECKVTTTFLITQIFYKYFFIYFFAFLPILLIFNEIKSENFFIFFLQFLRSHVFIEKNII